MFGGLQNKYIFCRRTMLLKISTILEKALNSKTSENAFCTQCLLSFYLWGKYNCGCYRKTCLKINSKLSTQRLLLFIIWGILWSLPVRFSLTSIFSSIVNSTVSFKLYSCFCNLTKPCFVGEIDSYSLRPSHVWGVMSLCEYSFGSMEDGLCIGTNWHSPGENSGETSVIIGLENLGDYRQSNLRADSK